MKWMLLLEEALGNWLIRDYGRRSFTKAKARAFVVFAQTYPQYKDYLFDEHLLTHRAAILLEGYLQGKTLDPSALAHSWADDWALSEDARARFMPEVTSLAAVFLAALETELERSGIVARVDTGTPALTNS